jgi:hypothetical protein
MTLRRDWSLANEKAARERSFGCRVCGRTDRPLERAHVVDRENDRRIRGRSLVVVDPDLIVLLCGPFPGGCHGAYDEGAGDRRLDLYPYLTPAELAAAYAAVGEGPALRRIRGRGWSEKVG